MASKPTGSRRPLRRLSTFKGSETRLGPRSASAAEVARLAISTRYVRKMKLPDSYKQSRRFRHNLRLDLGLARANISKFGRRGACRHLTSLGQPSHRHPSELCRSFPVAGDATMIRTQPAPTPHQLPCLEPGDLAGKILWRERSFDTADAPRLAETAATG